MTDHRPIPPGQRPKVAPEIIPPGSSGARPKRIWHTIDNPRVRVVRVEARGLFAVVLALLLLGIMSVALLALLLGVLLLWIPLAVGFAGALILTWLLRGRGQ
jgi:uncharacterized membrane protein